MLLATAAMLGACSSEDGVMDLAMPKSAGSRGRECVDYAMRPLQGWGPAQQQRATWDTLIVDADSAEQIATWRLELSFWSAGSETYPRRLCSETIGVPTYLAFLPSVKLFEYKPRGQELQTLVSAAVMVQGPARVRNGIKLNHPTAHYRVKVYARSSGIELITEEDLPEDFGFAIPEGAKLRLAIRKPVRITGSPAF